MQFFWFLFQIFISDDFRDIGKFYGALYLQALKKMNVHCDTMNSDEEAWK